MESNTKELTAKESEFQKYITHITECIVNEFGTSYETPQGVGNKWLYQYSYSDELRNFLIDQTNLYIRTMDTNDPKSTNLGFLRPFTKMISDYLALYTMRANAGYKDASSKDKKQLRRAAAAELYSVLFDNSKYIKHLQQRQDAQRRLRNQGQDAIKHAQHRNKVEQAKKDFEIMRQVRKEFHEAKNLRIK